MNDESREKMLKVLSESSDAVLSLAVMYAQGFEVSGRDVTKEWLNAVQNTQLIESIYRRGYEDAFKDIAERKQKDFYHKVLVDLKE